jgi:hypothetical protein
MIKMPDFIIIGAMKCATSTLHEQLSRQPGIFMTEPKEPFFFSNDEVWAKGLDWYADLFREASKRDLCGESSTHYTKLPTYPKTIERMRKYVPDIKLIYVIRHPIDRLISHYIHDWTENKINTKIDDAIISNSEMIAYSRYAMQIQPFLESFGSENVLLVFFEHLISNSQCELERIARFIGYTQKPHWHARESYNVSAKRLRRSPIRDAIVWNPLSDWIRRNFVPQSLRDWVKGFWQMQNRPQLSKEMLSKLEQIFDDDLSQLSQWVDVDLSCQNFKQVAMSSMQCWSSAVPERKQFV